MVYRMLPDGKLKDYYRDVLDRATAVAAGRSGRARRLIQTTLDADARGLDPDKRLYAGHIRTMAVGPEAGRDWRHRRVEVEGRLPIKMPTGPSDSIPAVAGVHEPKRSPGHRPVWVNLPLRTMPWDQLIENGEGWRARRILCSRYLHHY